MLLTNQRLDKLAASRADFIARNMLPADRAPRLHDQLRDLVDTGPDNADEMEEGGPSDEDRVLSHVHLARTRGKPYAYSVTLISIDPS